MSFFDDASLVMIPSGYKDQKVYSVKPTDGSGDLTFSRASSATRVQSDGLIEKVRTNLVLQSETFNNASWGKTSLTATANTTANPLNGAVTAETITLTAGTTQKYLDQSFAQSGLYSYSVYAKVGTHNFIQLMLGTDSSLFANFNISTGAVTASTGCVASVVSAGNGWYRCSIAYTTTIGTDLFVLAVDNGTDGRFSPSSSTGTFFLFGAQFETGDIATDYIATTTAAVSVGPVSGLPRLDYYDSTCPKLLLEPQRTNLALNSESFDNATWTKTNVTITANNLISPDGFQNADLANFTSGSNSINGGNSFAGNASVTISTFVKAGTISIFRIRESFYTGVSCVFDLSAQTTGAGGKIDNYGNGWYRCSFTYTLGVGQTNINWIFDSNTAIGSLYLWGAQAEVGAYATSYIPTLGASVTRVADIASKTGISSLIGQTEGTLFAEFTRLNVGNAVVMFQCNDGTTNNRAQLEIGATGIATTSVLSGGAVSCVITGATLALGQTHKLALTYKANDFKLYVNGVLAGTDTSGAVPISMSRIDLASELGTSFSGVSISQILNFTTALNNAQAIELTA
jgi:hypothetical protein